MDNLMTENYVNITCTPGLNAQVSFDDYKEVMNLEPCSSNNDIEDANPKPGNPPALPKKGRKTSRISRRKKLTHRKNERRYREALRDKACITSNQPTLLLETTSVSDGDSSNQMLDENTVFFAVLDELEICSGNNCNHPGCIKMDGSNKVSHIGKMSAGEPTSAVHSPKLLGGEMVQHVSKNQECSAGPAPRNKQSIITSLNLHDYSKTSVPPTKYKRRRPNHKYVSATQTPIAARWLNSSNVDTYNLLFDVHRKLNCHIYSPWHILLKNDALHVIRTSEQDNIAIQRNLIFWPSGKVELYVHCRLVSVERYLNNLPSVVLTPGTVDKFVNRLIKIVDAVMRMDICIGFDNEELKVAWSICPLGQVDKNPYKESRYYETFRSFNCLKLVERKKLRCDECKKLSKPLRDCADFAIEDPFPNRPTCNTFFSLAQK